MRAGVWVRTEVDVGWVHLLAADKREVEARRQLVHHPVAVRDEGLLVERELRRLCPRRQRVNNLGEVS